LDRNLVNNLVRLKEIRLVPNWEMMKGLNSVKYLVLNWEMHLVCLKEIRSEQNLVM